MTQYEKDVFQERVRGRATTDGEISARALRSFLQTDIFDLVDIHPGKLGIDDEHEEGHGNDQVHLSAYCQSV